MDFFLKNPELIGCISYLIPLIVGWMLFSKAEDKLRFFIIILSISFIFSLIGYYTGRQKINNLLIYFLQYVVEFYLYSLLFKRLLHAKYAHRIIHVFMVLFVCLIILNHKNIYPPKTFESYTPAFLSLSMLLYCILFFNQELNNLLIPFIYKTSWFWIVTGFLLFYAGNFLILLVTNYLMNKNISFIIELWTFQELLKVVENLLVVLGLFYIKKK